MSQKREIWLTEYLKSFNATDAARRAGYKWPDKYGSQLKEQMSEQIDEAIQKNIMSRQEALNRLAAVARFDISPYIDDYGKLKSLNVDKLIADGYGHLIRSIKHSSSGTTIEWSNPDDALKMIINETHPTGSEADPNYLRVKIEYANTDDNAS